MTDWLILFGAGLLMGVGLLLLWDVTVDAFKDWWRDN